MMAKVNVMRELQSAMRAPKGVLREGVALAILRGADVVAVRTGIYCGLSLIGHLSESCDLVLKDLF